MTSNTTPHAFCIFSKYDLNCESIQFYRQSCFTVYHPHLLYFFREIGVLFFFFLSEVNLHFQDKTRNIILSISHQRISFGNVYSVGIIRWWPAHLRPDVPLNLRWLPPFTFPVFPKVPLYWLPWRQGWTNSWLDSTQIRSSGTLTIAPRGNMSCMVLQ